MNSENIKNKDDRRSLKESITKYTLNENIDDNISLFKNTILKNDSSVVYREFKNKKLSLRFCLIFVDGMINNKIINESIIDKLMNCEFDDSQNIFSYIKEDVISVDEIKQYRNMEKILGSLLYGDSLLLVDGFDKGLIINTKGWETRSISEPQAETVVRGPREGFNESLITNMSLVRRKINSPDLKFEYMEVGVRTKTKVAIAYIDKIVNEKILDELKMRLDKLCVDGIFSSETIKETISDFPMSPFKTIGHTERPDVVASKILQGRIAIIVDGSPVALTLPFLFIEYFQVNEDYYQNFIYASINRILRVIAFIITISIPALYVALTTFHKEMIPTKLILSIYSAKEGVPMPTAVEALIMLIIFEIIREAGIRLPKHIGAAVSIAGTLVLGDSAVNAKFVSAPIVIVIAITGIAELILYEMRTGVIVLRFIFLIFASFLGLYGVIFSIMGLLIHLMTIKSFGIPYMLKLIDLDKYNITDSGIRVPWWLLKYRTKFINKDNIRSKNYIKRRKK